MAELTSSTVPSRAVWSAHSAVIVVVPLAAGAAIANLWPLWTTTPSAAATAFCVAVAFSLVGLKFHTEQRPRVIVVLLIAAAFLWPTSFLTVYGPDLARLGLAGTSLFWFATTSAFVLYPEARPRAWDWAFIAYCLATLPGGELLIVVLGHSYAEARIYLEPLNVSLIVFVLALFVARWVRADYLERRSLTPLLGAVLIASAVTGVANDIASFGTNPEHVTAALTVNSLAILTLPGALVHATVRRRNDSLRAVEAFGALAAAGAGQAEVQQCLRRILRDDSLDILFWDEAAEGFIDSAGQPCSPHTSSRHAMPITDHRGVPVAVIQTSAALRQHEDLRRAVVSAGGMALRMQARLRALQLRGEEARLAEQERIQRDLHDRGQTGLAAVGLQLTAISEQARTHGELRDAVDEARHSLATATKNLRKIVEGIHPPLLTHHGLVAALEDLASRMADVVPDLELRLHLPTARLPIQIENAAYCVVNEVIANTLKHAPGVSLSIEATHENGLLTLSVADTGEGGARLERGRGLGALRDRCRTVGGELELSTDCGGSTVTALFPCRVRAIDAASAADLS